MAAKITFFQVGNGDMTLVRLADTRGTSILIDVHIRSAADNPNDDTPDVASALRSRLKYDEKDRPFIDVFMLSHPDQDHCGGLRKHFWLGRPEDYPDDDVKRSSIGIKTPKRLKNTTKRIFLQHSLCTI